MRLSKHGAQFIAGFEGFVPRPYNDSAGYATIGYGHLLHYSPVTPADLEQWGTISKARGLELLAQDARQAEAAIARYITIPLEQDQYDALVSFVFNVGAGGLNGTRVQRAVNSRAPASELAAALEAWSWAGGRQLPGLLTRRRAEAQLFNTGAARAARTAALAVLTPSEHRWATELERLRGHHGRIARYRRRALLRRLVRERKLIWQAAQHGGWTAHHRAQRYRILRALTSGG